MHSIINQIETIMSKNEGKIYSVDDFNKLGTSQEVKDALYKLNQEGSISRLVEGLYTKPEYSELLDIYAYPDPSEVAKKLAEMYSWRITPNGNAALNYTGLCTQVPNTYRYYSDGPTKEYQYRKRKITFQHTNIRNIESYPPELAIVIQAIKALGKNKIKNRDLEQLAFYVRYTEKDFIHDIYKLPVWIQEALEKIRDISYEETFRITP